MRPRTCRQFQAVTDNIVTIDNNVANIDAHVEGHAFRCALTKRLDGRLATPRTSPYLRCDNL